MQIGLELSMTGSLSNTFAAVTLVTTEIGSVYCVHLALVTVAHTPDCLRYNLKKDMVTGREPRIVWLMGGRQSYFIGKYLFLQQHELNC